MVNSCCADAAGGNFWISFVLVHKHIPRRNHNLGSVTHSQLLNNAMHVRLHGDLSDMLS